MVRYYQVLERKKGTIVWNKTSQVHHDSKAVATKVVKKLSQLPFKTKWEYKVATRTYKVKSW